jgi:alkylation response protein AidB-like acyl-CoA dehydrogenase
MKRTPEEIRAFAREEVFSTLADRYESRRFSRGLWKKMAGAGFFGFLIPVEYGGCDRDPVALVDAVEAFMLGGQDLGLCLSWLDHLLIHSHVIARFGSEEQKLKHLPGLVRGDRVGALAASEPETGANPARMKARAEERDGAYRIHGHKIFITNGPVADCIIVLARTGQVPGKEGISAFLLDTDSPGFRVQREMDFGFLHTSPHGELVFEDCPVPPENLLGRLGDGHVRISRAVFGWERFMGMVTLCALFRLILDHTIRRRVGGGAPLDGKTNTLVAELHIALEGLREFSRKMACEVLDRNELDTRLMERLLFGVGLLTQWWERFDDVRQGISETLPFPLAILLKDARLLDVNKNLYALQTARIAEALIHAGGQRDVTGGYQGEQIWHKREG